MASASTTTVREASWRDDRQVLQSLRREIFVREQGVPETLEWDEFDAVSLHALAFDLSGRPVGTGRLLPDGHIGRMAVLRDWRRRGVGSAILGFLLEQGRQRGLQVFRLHAQTHALAFYQRHGFVAEGDEFEEAGIPHRLMTFSLQPR